MPLARTARKATQRTCVGVTTSASRSSCHSGKSHLSLTGPLPAQSPASSDRQYAADEQCGQAECVRSDDVGRLCTNYRQHRSDEDQTRPSPRSHHQPKMSASRTTLLLPPLSSSRRSRSDTATCRPYPCGSGTAPIRGLSPATTLAPRATCRSGHGECVGTQHGRARPRRTLYEYCLRS